MGAATPPPIQRYYLCALIAPQQIRESAEIMKEGLRSKLGITAPMPPILPIKIDRTQPKQPVVGNLPVFSRPLIPGNLAVRSCPGGSWIIWEWDAGDWPERLASALSSDANAAEAAGAASSQHRQEYSGIDSLFPLGKGIPLAPLESAVKSTMSDEFKLSALEVNKINFGWRTLELACWEIETLNNRPWYRATAWQMVWKRRLKRAAKPTNNSNPSELA